MSINERSIPVTEASRAPESIHASLVIRPLFHRHFGAGGACRGRGKYFRAGEMARALQAARRNSVSREQPLFGEQGQARPDAVLRSDSFRFRNALLRLLSQPV